jgi:hypothetical protein
MTAIQIRIIGDSHVDAIKRAMTAAKPDPDFVLSAQRIRRMKEAAVVGDIELTDFLQQSAALDTCDLVVSAMGGNQYNAFGLVQHPQAFDFFLPGRPDLKPLPNRQILPYQLLLDMFRTGVGGKDGERLKQLRAATKAKVLHLCPPPPKEDAALILQKHETLFVKQGLLEHGVTPASIRLKLWLLQTLVMRDLCREYGVKFIPVPDETCTAVGYLQPAYYANDATHANPAYAALQLERLKALTRVPAGSGERTS